MPMSELGLFLFLKPFLTFLFAAVFLAPPLWLVRNFMPEGRVKRLLLLDMTTEAAPTHRRVTATVLMLSSFVAIIGWAVWLGNRP